MHRFLFIIAFLFALTLLSPAESCDSYVESWQLCANTTICRERMFIDINGNDMVTFRDLIHRHPANEQVMLDELFCNDNSTQQARELWVLLMAHSEYCPDKNEFYVSGLGCVCKDNKICEYNASRKIFSFIDNSWAMGILSATTMALGGYAIYVLRARGPLSSDSMPGTPQSPNGEERH